MIDLFLGGAAAWFTIPAVVGTLYFLFQLVLMQAGGDLGLDGDADFDTSTAHDAGHEFKVISLQSISAFCMGGGWMGLASYRLLDLSVTVSAIIALASGVAVAWMLVAMLRAMLGFQSSGNIAIASAAGLEGEVYIEVPGSGRGTGRVKLIIEGRQREYDAAQEGEAPIPTGTRVRVARIEEGSHALVVERA